MKGTLISIALGLFVGFFIILFVKKENPFVVYKNILAIPFSSKYLFKKLLFQIGVFILLGSSMAIGFKYNVFNIGATAQMLMSFLICYVLIQYKLLPDNPVSKVLLILISLIFGVLVGLLIGLLKIYFNIHEVVSSIFLNYIIFYLIVYIGEKYLPINIAQKGFFIPTLEDDKFSNYIFSPARSSNQYIFVL
ncbi:MAG: ABC transporter permease, partial [Mycoplasma sp.]|nr:ABC transporter permease [Mycoplasma sp.]